MGETLADLAAEGLKLRVWCNRCGHRAELDPAPLAEAWGPQTPIYGAWRRLRCSRCDARGRRQGDVFSMPQWPTKAMGFSRAD